MNNISKIGGWDCSICSQNFRTRKLMQEHKKIHGVDKAQIHKKVDFICPFCKKEYIQKYIEYKSQHINHCKENPNRMIYKGHKHTEEEKRHLSEIAKEQKFGGWHASKRYEYKGIILDSSYEVQFAKDLDKSGINWERPSPLIWKDDSGKEHRYYPDFYILKYNIFVDTKNDYLINNVNPRFGITDVEKIHLVEQQNNVKIYILDKNNLLWSSLHL